MWTTFLQIICSISVVIALWIFHSATVWKIPTMTNGDSQAPSVVDRASHDLKKTIRTRMLPSILIEDGVVGLAAPGHRHSFNRRLNIYSIVELRVCASATVCSLNISYSTVMMEADKFLANVEVGNYLSRSCHLSIIWRCGCRPVGLCRFSRHVYHFDCVSCWDVKVSSVQHSFKHSKLIKL